MGGKIIFWEKKSLMSIFQISFCESQGHLLWKGRSSSHLHGLKLIPGAEREREAQEIQSFAIVLGPEPK